MNFTTICNSGLLFFLVSTLAMGGEDIGATYDIEEPDALQEINDRAKAVDWKKVMSRDPSKWSALKSAALPIVTRPSERLYQPFYTLDADIPDKDGKLLYSKGFRFNPLDHYQLPGRVIVIAGHRHLPWLREVLAKDDVVITAGGNPKDLGAALGQPVYTFDPRMKERFGIHAVPSIVLQQGNAFLITEIKIKDAPQ